MKMKRSMKRKRIRKGKMTRNKKRKMRMKRNKKRKRNRKQKRKRNMQKKKSKRNRKGNQNSHSAGLHLQIAWSCPHASFLRNAQAACPTVSRESEVGGVKPKVPPTRNPSPAPSTRTARTARSTACTARTTPQINGAKFF